MCSVIILTHKHSYLQQINKKGNNKSCISTTVLVFFRCLCQKVQGKGHPITYLCRHKGEVKVQFQPFRNIVAGRGWVVNTPRRLLYPRIDTVPIVQEDEWTSGPVWEGRKNLISTGIRFPVRPARSESPYRLRYPCRLCFQAVTNKCRKRQQLKSLTGLPES